LEDLNPSPWHEAKGVFHWGFKLRHIE
jgi:hypothetical protein